VPLHSSLAFTPSTSKGRSFPGIDESFYKSNPTIKFALFVTEEGTRAEATKE
jgi:hypothetical protein